MVYFSHSVLSHHFRFDIIIFFVHSRRLVDNNGTTKWHFHRKFSDWFSCMSWCFCDDFWHRQFIFFTRRNVSCIRRTIVKSTTSLPIFNTLNAMHCMCEYKKCSIYITNETFSGSLAPYAHTRFRRVCSWKSCYDIFLGIFRVGTRARPNGKCVRQANIQLVIFLSQNASDWMRHSVKRTKQTKYISH